MPSLTECAVEDFTALADLKALRDVHLYDCPLISLDWVSAFAGCLEDLAVSYCTLIESSDAVGSLWRLKVLTLNDASITEIEFPAGCPLLQTLNLSSCKGLTGAAGMAEMPLLRSINIHGTGLDPEAFPGTAMTATDRLSPDIPFLIPEVLHEYLGMTHLF